MNTPRLPATWPPIRQGDVYFVEVPGTIGSEQSGRRPYVILSRDAIHERLPTVVGVPLSRNIKKANAFRILVPAAEILPAEGHRFDDSVALCDHVRVIDKSILREKAGRLTRTAVYSVSLGLAYVFDLR